MRARWSRTSVGSIGESGILFVSAALFVIAIVCQRVSAQRSGRIGPQARQRARTGRSAATGSPASRSILRSPYLLGIALFIVGISAVSTLLYFEQLRIV